ncbi:integrator complex subunit 12-like [Watersipora subatra]|uniref:integrator complex subunit 12-like n=1 Tax=Watersipora subatra TaxID=2589382 RepID=UPI00355C9C5D
MEIDPTFQKALQLLISRKPDSGEKLKEMLFESLGREYIPPSSPKIVEPKLKSQVSHSQDSVESLDEEEDELNEMEMETDYSTDVGGNKNDDTMDADDFAFGMGISCVICRQFDVTSNNQLLECMKCGTLYHQLCHKPPVEMQDNTDTWHCYKCLSSSASSSSKEKLAEQEENLIAKKEKTSPSDSFKKPSKKSEKNVSDTKKTAESSSLKDKKLKTDKRVKEKLAEKIKEAKKHKSAEKEVKSESGRKEKLNSKAGEAAKSSTGSSGKHSSKDKLADRKSSADLKHKKSDSGVDKEKKAKKLKREKAD